MLDVLSQVFFHHCFFDWRRRDWLFLYLVHWFCLLTFWPNYLFGLFFLLDLRNRLLLLNFLNLLLRLDNFLLLLFLYLFLLHFLGVLGLRGVGHLGLT